MFCMYSQICFDICRRGKMKIKGKTEGNSFFSFVYSCVLFCVYLLCIVVDKNKERKICKLKKENSCNFQQISI